MTDRARTKIVATVGPACQASEMLSALVERGVDVFRLNMAHGDRAQHQGAVERIDQVRRALHRPIGILVDLAGPKMRLGQLQPDPFPCTEGAHVRIVRGDVAQAPDELVTSYEPLIDELAVGDNVMLADGLVALAVTEKTADQVTCQVMTPGEVRSRQGVNLPGVRLAVPAITSEDLDNAIWAAGSGIDFVSLSFVRAPEEVRQLKQLLLQHGSEAHVIAKIEKPEALRRLDEIVQAADAIMVARGDLGVEIDVATMPVAQKRIVDTCTRYKRPVIVATQMLESMHYSRRPTRAEVTDVANAILDGADACMLSGETAIGNYPRETVEMMNRIMLSTEQMLRDAPPRPITQTPDGNVHPITDAVVFGAGRIAQRANAKLVVIVTLRGATALAKAKQRDFIPSVAVCERESTLRRMSLYWGIQPLPGAPLKMGQDLRRYIEQWGRTSGLLSTGDRVVFVTGTGVESGAHNAIILHEVAS